MSLIEAQDLGDMIRDETGAHVTIRQIGNGEWVVFLSYYKYIWDAEDWQRVKDEEKP
jgi:hypothetical protein